MNETASRESMKTHAIERLNDIRALIVFLSKPYHHSDINKEHMAYLQGLAHGLIALIQYEESHELKP